MGFLFSDTRWCILMIMSFVLSFIVLLVVLSIVLSSFNLRFFRFLIILLSQGLYNVYYNKKLTSREEEEHLIPPNLFTEKKEFILVELPFCESNENVSKRFISKIHEFRENKYEVAIKWITKKVRSLFSLKDKNPYPSCQIYEGVCICGENYIGETIRNVIYQDLRKDSEPAKHLGENPQHPFTWKTLMPASKNFH